jgi:F0F1-type ATP synthase assembly protein I
MIKTAEPKSTAAHPKVEDAKPKKELTPGGQFMSASLAMSWQLAIVVLVPIIGGYKLDQHLGTTPYLLIIGFILAMAGTYLIVKRAFSDLNENVYNKDKK